MITPAKPGFTPPELLTDLDAVVGLMAEAGGGDGTRRIDPAEFMAALRTRVRGQDHILEDLARHIEFEWRKKSRRQPVAALLLLGPPGTGKSELAKALAEYLYGDEKNMLVFDGPDLSGPEAKTRLIGTPEGYVGAERGGSLTTPVKSNPRQVIVFEEVEKAYPDVFDLFLSLLGDGRLNEARTNKPVDFTQCLVVLTGNAEHDALARITTQVADPLERGKAIKDHLAAVKVFRPEFLRRISRVYVFNRLAGRELAEVAVLEVAKAAAQFDLELARVEPAVVAGLLIRAQKSAGTAGEVRFLIQDLFGEQLIAAQEAGHRRVSIAVGADGRPTIVPST